MKEMRRRLFLQAVAATCFAADTQQSMLRGKLAVREGKAPAIVTPENRNVDLECDEQTLQVLNDSRLDGMEIQARGKLASSGRFAVDAAHTRPVLVNAKGQWKLPTYWCDICAIRAYTPGPCACCQRYTDLDLRDPENPEQKK
jgi:hypothetical protein